MRFGNSDFIEIMKLGGIRRGFAKKIKIPNIADVQWWMETWLFHVGRSVKHIEHNLLGPTHTHEIGRLAQWQGA